MFSSDWYSRKKNLIQVYRFQLLLTLILDLKQVRFQVFCSHPCFEIHLKGIAQALYIKHAAITASQPERFLYLNLEALEAPRQVAKKSSNAKLKTTIRDGGSTVLYAVDTVHISKALGI